MSETIFTNGRIVLPDEVVNGTLITRDGVIAEVLEGRVASPADDLEGDFLLPGLVELHTDHLENHYHPRPGVAWPAIPAVMAHDAQIVAAGITTVFDALRAGTFDPGDLSAHHARLLSSAISEAQRRDQLRASHFICVANCHVPIHPSRRK